MSGIDTKFMCSMTFSYSHDCRKCGKRSIFSKILTFFEPDLTVEFLVFHPQDPKPKWIHQIASNRAKTRSTRSQTGVKYRGIIIFI